MVTGHKDCRVCHGEGYDEGEPCDCTRCELCWHEFSPEEQRFPDPEFFQSHGDTFLCGWCILDEDTQNQQVIAALHDLGEHGWVFVEDDYLLECVRQHILPGIAYTVDRIGGTWRIGLEGK